MNDLVKVVAVALVASVIGGFVAGLVGNQSSNGLGASTGPAFYGTASFLQGLNGGTRDQFTVSNTGVLSTSAASTFGADVTITTTNTATSSIEVGCIDTYATSTDTAVRLSATTTPGIAYWTYGTCAGL